jgi:hypothetical protein
MILIIRHLNSCIIMYQPSLRKTMKASNATQMHNAKSIQWVGSSCGGGAGSTGGRRAIERTVGVLPCPGEDAEEMAVD